MLFALLLLAVPSVQAEPRLVCDQLRLMNASGVIGTEHRYTFTAHCSRHASETKDGKTTNVVWLDFDVTGKGRWERKTGQASETLEFTGSAAGVRFAAGVCTQDPWLMNPPGGLGGCQSIVVQAKVEGGAPVPMEVIEPRVFLLARMVALAEAQALSLAQGSGSTPAPPPDPTPAPIPRVRIGDQPVGGGTVAATQPVVASVAKLVIEGEDLVRTRKFQVNSGRIAIQPMAGFGPYWSGNAQLLWAGSTVGGVLDLIVDIAVADRYAVALYPTMAPDYGDLKFEVDGRASAFSITGFRPKVTQPGRCSVGTFYMSAGSHRVSLMISGRSTKSMGYLVGIDRIEMTRIESP
jgi:hypothetical protein